MADIARPSDGLPHREAPVNLDLPFDETDPAVVDELLAEIDRTLDALFLDAVGGELERLRLERLEGRDDAAA